MTDARPSVRAPSPAEPAPAEYDLLCDGCGYSLLGLMSSRCPECGLEFDPKALPLARVPWLYRKRLGSIGSYLRTIAMILIRPRRFAKEICRPVRISHSDAKRFRVLTVYLGVTAGVLFLAVWLHFEIGSTILEQLPLVLLIAAVTWIFGVIWLRLATDLPTFIWKGLPKKTDDLSPLHHYACAPVALFLPAAALCAAAILWIGPALFGADGEPTAKTWLGLSAILLPIVLLIWIIPAIFMRTATGCWIGRCLLLISYLPIHWLLMAMLIYLAVAAAAFAIMTILGFE